MAARRTSTLQLPSRVYTLCFIVRLATLFRALDSPYCKGGPYLLRDNSLQQLLVALITLRLQEEIKRLIYTTNAVEPLHRQLRKVMKTKSMFPTDGALIKMLFLSSREASKKWTLPVKGWKEALSYFGIAYEDRLLVEKGV